MKKVSFCKKRKQYMINRKETNKKNPRSVDFDHYDKHMEDFLKKRKEKETTFPAADTLLSVAVLHHDSINNNIIIGDHLLINQRCSSRLPGHEGVIHFYPRTSSLSKPPLKLK